MANLKDLIVSGPIKAISGVIGDLTGTAEKATKDASGNTITTTYATKTEVNSSNKNTMRSTEFIVGTQTGTTKDWLGVTEDSSLYDGKNINYFLNQTSAANATLNLTLAGGTTTGAKPVYLNGTSYVGTHFPINSVVNLTYNATKGAWFVTSFRDTNDINRTQNSNNIYAVAACTAGKLICGTSSGYKDIAASVTFDIDYPILYCGTAAAATKTCANNYYYFPGVNLQTTKASWTGTQWSTVYLVGTLSGRTFTVDSTVFTTTVPTSQDNKVYMPVGTLYSTYQCYFTSCKDLYAYKNGSFRRLEPDLSGYVPTSRKVNNKALTADITLSASDVGALSSHQTIKNHGVTGATINTFAPCSTAAGTAAKTASITTGTFALEQGTRVFVKFGNANTADNPTLNINSKGDKNIYNNGSQITTGTNKGLLKGICEFMYDGTQWHLIGNYIDTVYTHPTTSGNKHIPSGGSSGQFLKWSSDGTATWASDNDTKNTAGSTDSSSKLFLIGATSQASNPQTYSHDTVFVDTSGQINSVKPAANNGTTSTVVPTIGWINDASTATNVVHRDGTETISGAKTFSSAIAVSNATVINMTASEPIIKKNGTNVFRVNSTGGTIISTAASSGQELTFRPQGDGVTDTQMNIKADGSLALNNNSVTMHYNSTTEALEFVFA